MLRDVFYYNTKPNVHPREQFAESLEDARQQCTTEHFWIINEFCDYRNFDWDFDFEFLPDEDVWAEAHNNVWPSQHQKDSGTWLCPKEHSDIIIYRGDVDPVIRKNEKQSDNWIELDLIDHTKFDFSWHPDPSDPPYIYKWGCKFFPAELKHVLEYRVPNATQEKYMNTTVELLLQPELWVEHRVINNHKFDMTWRPNPMDPAFIYIWGNKYVDGKLAPTLEYHVAGATDKKYMPELLDVLPEWSKWVEVQAVDKTKFDFSWRPDPREPAYIYTWGNKFIDADLKPTLEYHCEGATERKYMSNDVAVLPEQDKWKILENIAPDTFDFSWRPDPREPALIYVFGNQYYDAIKMPTLEYHCAGATERKYMDTMVAQIASNVKLYEHFEDSFLVDYTWLPDPDSPPYIYVWGNQWNSPEDKISIQFAVPNATEYKYMAERAIRKPCMDNWIVPDDIDTTGFDFSWEPSPAAPPYIYEFATQWQKTGGPQYVVPGATEKQYVDFQKAEKLPSRENWTFSDNINIDEFDFSWHPDATSPAYIYVFATQWAFSGGPVYTVPGATETKYIDDQIAIATRDDTNWVYDSDLTDVENFDFSWHPYVEDQPYIYQFGTQWQKTGGPKYITPGADSSSPIKYIDTRILNSVRLSNPHDNNWKILNDYKIKDFDYSWHPDETEEPYIYVFGNTQYSAEECPVIEYRVPGATKIKYVSDIVATLDVNMNAWEIPDDIEVDDFDFSWIPKPNDPAYIYEFGTQWQKTGGPRYIVPTATETKYLTTQKVTKIAGYNNWQIPNYIERDSFDFSWHPDATEPAYIYQFGTQWALSGGPKYSVDGATEIKYMDLFAAKALPDKTNWEYDPKLIDEDSFDFSWHPYVEDQPYIYQFGTQWQKTGGPKYITPGADIDSPKKYIDTRIIQATRLPNRNDSKWNNLYPIKDFDYSWHPDETEEPYIYVFGNKQYLAEECATIEYRVPNATTIKYIPDITATLAAMMDNWIVPEDIDTGDFDFSWIPNPSEPAYIYEFGTQWQKTGGPKYVMPGAWRGTKYVDVQKAKILPNRANWTIPDNINVSDFDFSWHPDSTEPAYIYRFGTQWALSGGPVYTVPGATELKYMDNPTAIALPNKSNWKYDQALIDVDSFDFSWHPYAEDEPFIYQFGTQHQKTGGPRYFAPGATNSSSVKYVDTRIIKATRLTNKSSHWKVLNGYEIENFDYSWHPDETTEPYIYVFGNTQYSAEEMPTIQYVERGAESLKYINTVKAKLAPNMANWNVPKNIDTSSFDFSWVPHPKSPPYIYEFATIWNDRGGPSYVMPGATDHFYVEDVKAKTVASRINWEVPQNIDVRKFDFSWVPHPLAPPYIYQFGTKLNNSDGPKYIVPGNNGEIVYLERVELENDTEVTVGQYYIETTLEDLVNQHPNEVFWALRTNINYDEFDFTWQPESLRDLEYVQVFGSTESELTQTYYVSANNYLRGNTSFKFVETVDLTDETLVQMFVKPDMFFVDRGNAESAARFENLKAKFGNKIQKTRYLNSWVDTINRCINRSTTELLWVLNSELDYTNFNFDYYPNPWQVKMVHVFGTQWSHWGTTFMVNSESFPEDTKYIKIIEHLSMLNFVKDRRAVATGCVYDIVVIDHGNDETDNVVELLRQKAESKNVTVVKYSGSYLNTIRSLVNRLPDKKEHYLWLCSSVCDYNRFDFSYICDPYSRDNLHVFPSGKQKFGDTFLIDVNKTKEVIGDLESLVDYQKVNYNGAIKTERLPAPEIVTSSDTLIDAVKKSMTRSFPYAIIMTEDNVNLSETEYEPINLWSPDTKNIIITSTGATRIVAPIEASENIVNEIYDFPYIKRAAKLAKSKPLDIVFLSNGETVAEQNYEHLLSVTHGLPNKIHRVDGIDGRTEAKHTAAENSETPWFFCVPAKLFVNKKFDWNYQADRLQIPKHYIFNAHNPVNDLYYGHQSMVLYNKNLALCNKGVGLDFTLDSPHMSVELNSGIIVGDTDEYSTWRTAFREAVKLKKYSDDGDEIAMQRLDIWTSIGKGNYGAWSIEGALDGLEFYDEVKGDLTQLRQSYYWDWLRTRFDGKY